MIYIATYIAGRSHEPHCVMAFDNKAAFVQYAYDATIRSDTTVYMSDSIDMLCDKLADKGPGIGSRWHRRIAAQDAKRAECPIYY